MNVQAAVDHHCRFTAMSVTSPGGMSDSMAFSDWGLATAVRETSDRMLRQNVAVYLVGDNAYTNSSCLLTPFTEPQTVSLAHDSFNFHLSQIRIRVEMAFGLLVQKFRLLKRPLRTRMKNMGILIHAIFRIHNFCITRRLQEDTEYNIRSDLDLRDESMTGVQFDGNNYSALYDHPGPDGGTSISRIESNMVRMAIVNRIEREGFMRPRNNIIRREAEDTPNE